MSKEVGTAGTITFDGNTVNIAHWEATKTSNNRETNETNADGTKSRVAGLKDISGRISGFVDVADPPNLQGLVDGAVGAMTLRLNATAGNSYSFSAILDNVAVRNPIGAGNPIEWSADFALASGAITSPV
jgi:hypothetical protein